MSRFDRVDVSTLSKCCVATVQRRVQLAVKGTRLACPCGRKILFTDGRWRRPADEMTSGRRE